MWNYVVFYYGFEAGIFTPQKFPEAHSGYPVYYGLLFFLQNSLAEYVGVPRLNHPSIKGHLVYIVWDRIER